MLFVLGQMFDSDRFRVRCACYVVIGGPPDGKEAVANAVSSCKESRGREIDLELFSAFVHSIFLCTRCARCHELKKVLSWECRFLQCHHRQDGGSGI